MIEPSNENPYHTDQISVFALNHALKNNEDLCLIDVRERFEYDICHLGGMLIPLNTLPAMLSQLNKDKHYVVLCHTGIRSQHAVNYMKSQGFSSVKNLTGGIHAWACEIDSSVAIY
jgi:sulfur-carrier protein adenylyltransferase/sulfurtransferase